MNKKATVGYLLFMFVSICIYLTASNVEYDDFPEIELIRTPLYIFLIIANLFGLSIVFIASDIAEEQKIKKFLKDRNDDFTDVDATTKYNKRWKIFTMVKRHDDAPWMDYKFRVWYNRKTGKMHKGKIRWMHEGW